MVGWRDLGFRSLCFSFQLMCSAPQFGGSVPVPAEPKVTAQFCFVNYDHSYLNLSLLLFLLPALSHSGVLLRPIVHLFCRLMQHIRHPSVFSSPWLVLPSFVSGFLLVHSVHAVTFVWVRDRQRDDRRLTTESSSCVSLLCRLFCPLLPAADVRTTFSPITSKGTSCIWTIRWGNAWMHAFSPPVFNLSHMMLFFFLLLWY